MSTAGAADPLTPPPPPASLEDVRARYPDLGEGEDGVAEALLADAWALLRVQAPSAAVASADPLVASVLRQVLCAMVTRVLRNPAGVRQEGVDDYQVTLDASRSTGALYLSPDELGAVRGALSGGGLQGAVASRQLTAWGYDGWRGW